MKPPHPMTQGYLGGKYEHLKSGSEKIVRRSIRATV
jgi:hypothetical protein